MANHRLSFTAGPLKGNCFPLREDSTLIGRDPSSQICIGDKTVSRRHCMIRNDGGRFIIRDLGSRQGTMVNGFPVVERILAHGDEVRIAGSTFLYLDRESEEAPSVATFELQGEDFTPSSSIELRMEESRYLSGADVLRDLSPFGRIARDLHALLKISTRISSIRGLEPLQGELLDLLFEVVPAERGVVILTEEGQDEFGSVYGLARSGPDKSIPVSRSVTQKVLREGIAVLCSDVLQDETLAASESLRDARVRSVLCVPLVVSKKIKGVIYLDTGDHQARMTEDHLQLAAAIAGIGASALENARQLEWLENECIRLKEGINIEHSMVGESAAIREVYRIIARAAPTDANVLILGESGTGKELVARAIHNNSRRADKPFLAINCAALVETLLESELFGHEKGAFTGAVSEKKGRLEIAHGGTLFLDEMGDLAPVLQAKLLRVLQEREFERVGGTRPIRADIRLIAATNKDLKEAVRTGSFRRDLYYRLNVVSVTLPPLRNRREDIPLLVSHFASKYTQKCGRKIAGISPDAQACLLNYSWPGNVRELENAIERAVVMGSSDVILPEDLPETVLEAGPAEEGSLALFHSAVRELKKQLITNAVQQAGGNYTEAAKTLGLHPNYLHRLIRNLNLKRSVSLR